jgi:hypothetical protein
MMKNLHEMGEEGCLLGLTITGDKSKSNFMTLPQRFREKKGIPLPNRR